MRKLGLLIVFLLLCVIGVFVAGGYLPGPEIAFTAPERYVGQTTPVRVEIVAPRGALSGLELAFEQNGSRTPLLSSPTASGDGVTVEGDRITVIRAIGKDTVPSLASGAGRLIVTAQRPVLFGMRHVGADAARDVEVRLERPRVSVLSTHHYINQGGSEMVVYRVSPVDVESGVRVGDVDYPGVPASGVAVEGVQIADPAVRVAFFALRHDQPVSTPISLYARDAAGNQGRGDFDYRVFPKAFKKSRINVDDRFLERVVPAVLAGTKEIAPQGSLIEQYVAINSELRRKNAERIASFAAKTSPAMLWRGQVFHAFGNTSAESAFADQRTYIYQGREVDHQVHLGYDLASVARAPIVASNRGVVMLAEDLGIYGQCVILDHGMGIQSLYAHLSSIGVSVGQTVDKGQELGRSGITGLAGGDHLHFTMLVHGQMVNPIEWWDSHWIEDRILRKLRTPW